MSCPRIFVSSTCYDLKHVREEIRKFIFALGYEPVLSEFSDVFYRPGDTVQNSCLEEIPRCDLFVLIVGQRYGSRFPEETLSITHKEYRQAQNVGIPIYSFVDLDVLHDYELFLKNNRSTKCQYRVVQDLEIFNLIEEIESASKDNSLITFSSIDDILQHLKKQWAKLLKSLLQSQIVKIEEIEEVPLKGFEELAKKLAFIGITDLNQDLLQQSTSTMDLVSKLDGKVIDNRTDYRIIINRRFINVGKDVVSILDKEFENIMPH